MCALEHTRSTFGGITRSRGHAAREMFTFPVVLSDGHRVRLCVEPIDHDRWHVTDRGMVAEVLIGAGVDLRTHETAACSWTSIMDDVRVAAPARGSTAHEIAGETCTERLEEAILELAEAAVQSAMLRVLAPGYSAQNLQEVLLATAGAHRLPVTPNASMPTRYAGSRRVTARIKGHRHWYLQAISEANSPLDSYDKAQSVLTSSAVAKDRRVAVLADDIDLEAWQWRTLSESGITLRRQELAAFFDGIARSDYGWGERSRSQVQLQTARAGCQRVCSSVEGEIA